ncbi:PREDICTED: dirigent protein 9-like [Camelina sativa]|uniref:Dirigent protein 9-like n=1 Tax=Camelina sativa TaxID=90675 RepID=A0ABM0ZAY5_CAMSA|nr:PREDICTED: dirigent protein 9-like [Camelina sativa]
MAKALHIIILLFLTSFNLLAVINSVRILDEIQPQPQLIPTGQIPTVAPTEAEEDDGTDDNPVPATTTSTASAVTVSAGPAGATAGEHEPLLEFFMHDVLGGSHPSARVVTGIVAQTEVNGIPFSKASNSIFPVDNGVPLVNSNNINSVINPNTAPLLTGLGGAQTSTVIQNTNGNSNDALSAAESERKRRTDGISLKG